MFEFFIENSLISKIESGFRPDDSCINKLFSIAHEIYQSFDDNLEVRAVFLDILRHLIRFGTKVLYSNESKMVYQIRSWILSLTSLVSENDESF